MPTTTKAQAMSNEITQIHEFQEGGGMAVVGGGSSIARTLLIFPFFHQHVHNFIAV